MRDKDVHDDGNYADYYRGGGGLRKWLAAATEGFDAHLRLLSGEETDSEEEEEYEDQYKDDHVDYYDDEDEDEDEDEFDWERDEFAIDWEPDESIW